MLLTILFLIATAVVAQTPPEVTYSDDFQSYGKNANPPGWIDSSIGNPHPQANGLYKTRSDPMGPNNGPNLVYGTNQASGKPESNNPRIGTFSTLSTRDFSGQGRFEYRGRMIRTNIDTRIGLTFFSSYPDQDKYYLLGLWSKPSGGLTMQLFGFGAGTLTGTVDSNVTLDPEKWYRFLIQVDDTNGATKIRARFWLDGGTEPSTYSIDATDAAASRLTHGHIGIWSAVKGDAYIDDLFAKSPVDHVAPVITIFESGTPLADGSKFNRNAIPEIRVTDDLSSSTTTTATLDGAPYASLTPVTTEGWHTLFVRATDGPGNSSELQVRFLVDKTAPVVSILEGAAPFPPNFFFNRNVVGNANVVDISQTTVTAAVDGQPYTLGTPIASEGNHTISVTAVDEVGFSTTAGPIPFVIDKTAPALTFTSHQNAQVLSVVHAVIAGGSDDAVTVVVAGNNATVDTALKVFATNDLPLLEGENTIVATGTDRAGNIGTATLKLIVDTRAPEVAITSPAIDACIDAATLQISGTVGDPRIDKVTVKIGTNSTIATVTGSTWTASIPVDEGKTLITIEATDTAGHSTSVSRSVTTDRTAPVIELSDVPAFTNRPVAFVIRVNDADPNLVVTSTLDGNAYASGASIAAEGKHTLRVVATDCAGHRTEKTVDVTIDVTPPAIRNLNPANDATVGTMPNSISGLTDTDVAKIEISGAPLVATPSSDGTFTIAAVPFAEGTNRFTLVATDRAGNSGSLEYKAIVKTNAPVVDIRESGVVIPSGAIFNRAITPVIRANDPQATIAATLNGAPYNSGTTIETDGDFTLHATATDSIGHSGSADATFTIDRTPPVVKITSPVAGPIVSDHVQVRGTAGDSISATVNGEPVALAADGTFVLESLTLDPGRNPIIAAGRDRAGNTGRDAIEVTRDDAAAGIILTYPPDRSLTNRSATDVVGRLLTPGRDTVVRIGSQTIETDPTGAFRVIAVPLTEGENSITATATAANGIATSATTHVTADFTPPSLSILESNQPLTDGSRFATQAVLSLQAADAGGGAVVADLSIDGARAATLPFTVTTVGGHSLVATASDLAGNESRAERTISIGASSGGGNDCRLEGFDPIDGSVIVSNTTTLIGRSGGALGVKVNGIAAIVADGSFSSSVELPSEGPNVVTIACTDSTGAPTGTPVTLTLRRITGDPSISIATPNEGAVTAQETIAVTGTIGSGVVSADVNGVPATLSGGTYVVPSVRLADGLNILVAHGRNAAGRVATASRRVIRQGDAPSVSISSPTANSTTGQPKITVSGTWANLVPDTLAVTNISAGNQTVNAAFVRFSDTTGSFNAVDVPLASGDQTLRVSGRDALNREASATVTVRLTAGSPSIVIASPANHSYFGGGSTTVPVSGTFQAAAGSTVDINGSGATIAGSSYSGSATFSALAGGITPVVARVTEPGGASAVATAIVTQLSDAPKVVESFPAPSAVEVDSGALLLVLFSQPMDVASLSGGAFRLQNANGDPVSGSIHLDKDVLTFAPATLLAGGGQYTLRVTTAAKNLAGMALAGEYTSSFTVATSAPAVAPLVVAISSAVCGQSITVNGTAPAGSRVRLESATLVLNAQADATGKFSFTWPISGQSGFALIRVRVVGSDGSVSPAAELNVRVDCSGPQVLNASFDRSVNKLTIQFSEPIKSSTITVGGSILLTANGQPVAGSATVDQNAVTVTPAENLAQKTFSLTVTTAVEDLIGNGLVAPHTQEFAIGNGQPEAGDGSGFISGEVYDATTGRPLPSAAISIDVASPAPVTTTSDARGRYLARLPEGAHTIEVALTAYTTVWREIIVPAGAGVIPIDIRLTRRGDAKTSDGSAIALTHGGDTAVTRKVDLTIPAGALPNGSKVALTAVGAQALTGLLPLGWSPIASAEIHVTGTAFNTGQLTFTVSAAQIAAATQNLSAVQYDAVRDEWRVIAAVVNVTSDDKASFPISSIGAFALVYPDKAPGLTSPPLPVAGDILQGVPAAPTDAPALVHRDFALDPSIVLPSGRTVATLRIEGGGAAKFPSGTAVQAYIDEELRLADGSRLLDPPFATDLLLYRTLSSDLGVADFHLAPSAKAAQVVLEIGFDHIRILPYPGRLDRGTLIGSEGGRVPADDKVAVEIPTGAVPEPLRATATSLSQSDLQAVGAIAGFRVVGGFQLTLQRATQPPPQDLDGDGAPDAVAPVELFVPSRATFSVDATRLPSPSSQVILGELLDQTPYGKMVRLAVPMMRVDATQASTPVIRFTTKTIDRSILPVDGVVHEGRYVVLAAEAPIAFATGTVRLTNATGRLLSDARVLAPPLGVAELTRTAGIYNIAVPARPAAPFTLVPRHTTTGDGVAYNHAAQIDPDAVVRVDLNLVAQPPVLGAVTVLKGDPPSQGTLTANVVTKDVALTTNIRAAFTPSIDPSSITADTITVTDASSGVKVSGGATAEGSGAVVWTLTAGERLKANSRYTVVIASSIRGANGAALARGATFSFSTVTQLVNAEIHRERIRITIPDANGLSRIIGDAGALPAGWQAVAVRRFVDFNVRYQATAASDGSFSFAVGNGGPAGDRVSMGDLIDLHVIITNGALAGIYSLTPFVTEDGKGFVAPVGIDIVFTSPQGITLRVPAGAFDVPTMITLNNAAASDFNDVPSIFDENNYLGSVRVDFEGESKKRLELEVPVPAGLDPANRQFLLAQKGMSMLGPRIEVIDLLRVENGKFTTVPNDVTGNSISVFRPKPGTNRTLTGSQFRKYVAGMFASGIFMMLDIKVPVGGAVGWALMEGFQAGYDLMWSILASYYIPHIHIFEHGGAIIPVIAGKPFTVTGIDPGTGLQAFSRKYDPVPIGEPFAPVPIPPAQSNSGGPYPVFATPFRVEVIDLDVENVDLDAIRNFSVRLNNGSARVSAGRDPLDSSIKVELMNITQGTMTSGSASGMTIGAEIGDRLVMLIEERDVDAAIPISVVFNEPIFLGGATTPDEVHDFLRGFFKLEQGFAPSPGAEPVFTIITGQATFATDSGGRRINVKLPSALQREAVYRLSISPNIADVYNGAAGLQLGQGTRDNGDGTLSPRGGGNALHLLFHVRKPAGALASFEGAPAGIIRGMELTGNMLFVAAMNGGLRAFDVSNPVSVQPLAYLPGPPESAVDHYSVTIDRHNRVYTTAHQPIVGIFRSYRAEDFANGGTNVPIRGSSIINWKLGYSSMIGLPSNTILSDRPESIPFRIKVATQDDEQNYATRELFMAGTGASMAHQYPHDVQQLSLSLAFSGDPYNYQRITVENLTLNMRWSADAQRGGSASFDKVIARSTDRLRVVRNLRTYAVVAHLGFGVGVYDANAIESNRFPGVTQATRLREQLVITPGKLDRSCPNQTPDWGIREGYINLDAAIRGDADGNLFVYSVIPYYGVLDLKLRLPGPNEPGTRDDSCDQRGDTGLLLNSNMPGFEVPRMTALKGAIAAAGGRAFPHFMGADQMHWSVTGAENAKGLRGTTPGLPASRDYMLVAGMDYGVIVIEIDSNPTSGAPKFPLDDDNVADVIWIPGGAAGVRVVQGSNVAVVNDGNGRVVVVDLSRIDERWDENGVPTSGLFPTAKRALAGVSSDPLGVGADDPRIVWKSEPRITSGSLPPVFDPETGMVYGAHMTNRAVKVVSAIDPIVRVKVNLGEKSGLSDVGGVVPLGIAPPRNLQSRIDALPDCAPNETACKQNASLGAFRLEVSLPGNILQSLGNSNNEVQVAIESERIAGATTEQTPAGFPRSHLRRKRADGTPEVSGRAVSDFKLERVVPNDLASSQRFQSGFNRFISPWIVAIADPRASEEWEWNGATLQQKKDAGCESCERPKDLKNLDEAGGVYELWTNGRYITVRPEYSFGTTTVFDGTPYDYLGRNNRFQARFSTIMADSVRATEVLTAAQNTTIADGYLQEHVYLHSGELESNAVDLIAGGRAGVDVVFDRTYRSRTIGGTFLGQGWNASYLRRLRALPTGDVEYRDEDGEVWRFRGIPGGGYTSPRGLFLRLTRTERGWKLIDQKWRITEFDDFGRLIAEFDEFFDPQNPESGNIIRYVYDDSGRLSAIVDPVKRTSKLTYWGESEGAVGAFPGLLKKVVDWRDRAIEYHYDPSAGTLVEVKLPDSPNSSGGRPAMKYAYSTVGSGFNDVLELRTNLESITDPHEAVSGGAARVRFTYGSGGANRDHLLGQQWATSETVSMTYSSPTAADTTDAFGLSRKYTLTDQPKDYFSDRSHVLSMIESGVQTSSTAFGTLPATITAAIPATSNIDRSFSFSYDGEGLLLSSTLNGVRARSMGYRTVQPAAPGFVAETITTSPQGGPAQSITLTTQYQGGENGSTFPSAIKANDKTVTDPQPHRKQLNVQATNSQIQSSTDCGPDGLLRQRTDTGGTDDGSGGASTHFDWVPNTGAVFARAMPKRVDSGGGMASNITYDSADRTTETDPRGVTLTTEYDPWRRPVHVTAAGPELTLDETFTYDASGRLTRHTRKQGAAVTTTYTYDVMGRRTGSTVDNVANVGTATSHATFDYPNRRVTIDHPGGSRTTMLLDGLGRVASGETTTGGAPIHDYFAYDLAGNLVFHTDLQTASAWAYDAHGRVVGEINPNGTRLTADVDAMGHPSTIRRSDAAGGSLGDSTLQYTDAGKLQSVTSQVGGGQTMVTQYTWDGAGRTTGTGVSGRASHATYDGAGRLISSEIGGGTAQSVSNAFERTEIDGHAGLLPQQGHHSDKSGTSYELALQFNTAGVATTQQLGSLEWRRQTDEAGNATSESLPNRGATSSQYDSRGAVKSEALPGGGTKQYQYDASGAPTSYQDPSSEVTSTSTDLVGRPTQRTYKDGTTETFVWEGRRVKSITDRAGRTQSFRYDARGHIIEIQNGSGAVLDEIVYDDAGRITSWKNADAILEYGAFDNFGRPGTTRQTRLRGGATLDSYGQTHKWDLFGKRTEWTMPTYAGLTSSAAWTTLLRLSYDDVGNLTSIQREATGGSSPSTLFAADYNGVSRPRQRIVTTAAGAQISRQYEYNASSQLSKLVVTADGDVVAGSVVTYDGLQKKTAQLLGLSSGARANEWSYDGRSRLVSSVLGRDGGATPSSDTLTSGDFRSSLSRPSTTPVDPPSVSFTESSAGHRIERAQRGSVVENFSYVGGERTEDALFSYRYDDKGRLASATEKVQTGAVMVRRVLYSYAGNDRVVGRRAEYAPVSLSGTVGTWTLEDREPVIGSDQLPPDTTFVWDPNSDRLVSIFKAGASHTPNIDAYGGLVRQIIHADSAYDDPIEVKAADFSTPNGFNYLYPIYDEAGSGSLQIILNEKAEIVTRSAPGGAYGEDEVVILGAAVDRVGVSATKDDQAKITIVVITLRSTESLDASTLANGVRLAVVDAQGRVVRTSTARPTLIGSTVTWSLTLAEWTALIDPTPVVVGGVTLTPYAVSISVTNTLRASAWSSTAPILIAPAWARDTKPVFGSVANPVEVRESIASLQQMLDGIAANGTASTKLYEVPNLGALGTPRQFGVASNGPDPARMIVSSSFHAEPFQEPLTGKNYVRSRWFDPLSGTWMTPDPRGYSDSSNLYAYAGGDPVNQRDPTGAYEEDVHHWLTVFLAEAAGFDRDTAMVIGFSTQQLDMDDRDAMHGGANHKNMVDFHMVTPERLEELHARALDTIKLPGNDPSILRKYCGEVRRRMLEQVQGSETRQGVKKWRYVGEYLHALEDSFSHQKGIYERDFSKTYNTTIGHGLDAHGTDWTWNRKPLGMKMAREVYDQLRYLCMSSKGSACQAKDWSEIEGRVGDFINYNPYDHDEMTREMQGALGFNPIEIDNVLDYTNKIRQLDPTLGPTDTERRNRREKHETYQRHHDTMYGVGTEAVRTAWDYWTNW